MAALSKAQRRERAQRTKDAKAVLSTPGAVRFLNRLFASCGYPAPAPTGPDLKRRLGRQDACEIALSMLYEADENAATQLLTAALNNRVHAQDLDKREAEKESTEDD